MANKNMQTYKTLSFEHQCQPILLATEIASADFCADYIVYEHNQEWAIGINKHSQLTVNQVGDIVDFAGVRQSVNHNNICQAIHQATQKIQIKDWRLFGRVDFEFCHFAHNLKQKETERSLLELFVPETDIRISKTHITIRTMDEAVIPQIQRIAADCNNYKAQPTKSHKSMTQKDIVQCEEVKKYYQDVVQHAVNEIKADKYKKVILSRPAILPSSIDIKNSFIAGRKHNTPARSFMLQMGGFEAFGFSPETVLEVDTYGNLSTQPLAGTRALPSDLTEAKRLKNELLTDPKEIAEHAASVKLAVEELEQVCASETVNIAEFMHISERGSVQHLASRVTGTLTENKSAWDAFKVLFPAITASGIPKREAIDAIARFEPLPRGLYSGSILVSDQNGYFDAALILRAAYKHKSLSILQAGAGIISLSTPQREWEETCEKMACVLNHLVFSQENTPQLVPSSETACEEES